MDSTPESGIPLAYFDSRIPPATRIETRQVTQRGESSGSVRAAVQLDARHASIVRVPRSALQPGQVRVRVEACGICGSNLHGWFDRRHAFGPVGEPGMVGHEIAGTVIETTTDSSLEVGAPVCVEPNQARSCGQCRMCRDGAFWFCAAPVPLVLWGFSDEVVVRADSVYRLPDGVGASLGALVEPLACSLHAVRHSYTSVSRGGHLDGARVAIVGAGAVGLFAVAAAVALGAADVAVLARYQHQAEAARQLGATKVSMTAEADHEAALRQRHPELVVEAVGGKGATLDLAAGIVGPAGEIAVLGLFEGAQTIDARRATLRETRLFFPVVYGCLHGRHDFDLAIEILAKDPGPFEDLITHRFPLSEITAAFDTAADKTSGSLKVLVEPQG